MNASRMIVPAITLLFSVNAWAYEVKQVAIDSSSIDKKLATTVVLPDSYASGDDRYSTVYVLHGWSGDNTDWTVKSGIAKLADTYNVILVMPDGDYDKWYIDSPIRPKSNYESYVSKDIVSAIDKKYRTVAEKSGRAITGLSMGGFGALNIAVNHQDTFGAVASLSGGVDPRDFPRNWGLEGVFGDPVNNAKLWNEKAIINNAHRFIFSGIAISLDCGTDDFFIDVNRRLHQKLLEMKVPHDYTERPGGHSWAYWDNAIKYQMLFLTDALRKEQAAAK